MPKYITMTNLKELLAQREALDRQITEVTQVARAAAIKTVQELVAEHGLAQLDIFPAGGSVKKVKLSAKVKIPGKYRDQVSGEEWSGRGRPPLWIKGKDYSQFLIG